MNTKLFFRRKKNGFAMCLLDGVFAQVCECGIEYYKWRSEIHILFHFIIHCIKLLTADINYFKVLCDDGHIVI